ncbi:MAG: hypothetical protein ACFE9S_00450 [Candidatus Hermodarchaeota archaeon]
MLSCQKLNLLKKIVILSVFLSAIPLTVIILVLGDISVLYGLFSNYIMSGKSLFIPFLPSYNVFWFLPKEAQIIQISTGQLIDLLIISGIVSFIEIVGYQYYKKICLNEDFIQPILIESNQEIFQDQGIFFGIYEGSSFSFKEKPSFKKYEKIRSFKKGLLSKDFILFRDYNFLQKNILSSGSKNESRFFNLHYNFEEINNNESYHHIIYPQIKTSIKIPNSFQYSGINMNYEAYYSKKLNRLIIRLNFIKNLISNNKLR